MMATDAPIETSFRFEVNGRGAAWGFRRGSGEAREGYYGGVIETLPDWRRNEYERNKQRRATAKARRP